MRLLKSCIYGVIAGLIFSGCGKPHNDAFLGSAVAESQTFQVSTTAQGQISAIFYREGNEVMAESLMAIIDTVPLIIQIRQLQASVDELAANNAAKRSEIRAAESDISGLQREFTRISGLAEKGSVPRQQADNLQTQLETARLRLDANRKLLSALGERAKGLAAQKDMALDQLRRCYVRSPARGIVLTRYKNPGEAAGPGIPIFEVGQFDTLYVDFFVPQPVVASLSYGDRVRIRLDYSDSGNRDNAKELPGEISWISSEAEFSPKNIQTRETRNELVFRIRALIANPEGMLKRGLPVEVWRDR